MSTFTDDPQHGTKKNGLQQIVINKLFSLSTILRLMDYRTFKGRMGEEDRLSVEVATMLRVASVEGRLVGTWTHVPHEVAARGKFAIVHMAKAKALGLIKGSSDFVFVWPDGGGWIELKTETGSLSQAQRDFRDWCVATGSRHAVCKSCEQVVTKLLEWGVLTNRG